MQSILARRETPPECTGFVWQEKDALGVCKFVLRERNILGMRKVSSAGKAPLVCARYLREISSIFGMCNILSSGERRPLYVHSNLSRREVPFVCTKCAFISVHLLVPIQNIPSIRKAPLIYAKYSR